MLPLNKIINNKINILGRQDYLKAVNNKPNEYGYIYDNEQLVKKLIQETQDKKANIYKNKEIPMEYINKFVSEIKKGIAKNKDKITPGITITDKSDLFKTPNTKYLLPMRKLSIANMRNAIGHELGHAKSQIDLNNKKIKLQQRYNDETYRAKASKIDSKHATKTEAIADKNLSQYLKKLGLDKSERRAHYYLYRHTGKENNITNNRYGGKFGNLKYLKDYIFGFSNPTRNS